jgi:hypothetical protein
MGMLTKSAIAGGGAALASEDAEAGWVMNTLGKPVLEAWHGGLKGIPRFEDKYLGTGEGAHVYTHGHYMADQRRTAKRYRNDRQREYDNEVSKDFFDSDLLTYYRANPNSYIQLEYGSGPPLPMRFDDYEEIVLEAAEMFGKNSEAAQDHINRKIFRRSEERRSWINSLSDGPYEEEDVQGIAGSVIGQEYWIEDSINALAYEVGVTPVEMHRSLKYDLQDSLPPETSVSDLSLRAQSDLMGPVVMERLNLVKNRMAREAKARRNVQFTGDPNNSNAPGPMAVADGTAPKAPNFEAKIPDEIAEQFGADVLFDFSKLKENPNKRQAGLYRLNADVQEDELLHWEQPLADHPESVKMAVSSAASGILDQGVASGRIRPEDLTARVPVYDEDGYAMSGIALIERIAAGEFPPGMTAADFATQFSQSVNPHAFMNGEELSKLLRSKGIKGMMYQDGWTRDKSGAIPQYNYVIYGDDLVNIMERGASTAPMNMLLAMGAGTGLAAPVLDKEIAERFPMPEREAGMMERIATNPNVQAAMKHPVAQYIGQQFDNAELPARALASVTEGIYNLTQGKSVSEIGGGMWSRLKTPHADTAQEAGEGVLDATNSPALAAAASTGVLLADPTNVIGP